MARYGIATILGDHPGGREFTVDTLPLHLTHIDSFETNLSADELADKLRSAVSHHKAFRLKVLADEFLGPDHDIPVTMLELTPELVLLHQAILTVLNDADASLKNPHFHGDYFKPHISIYGDRRVNIGGYVVINDICIAAKVSDDDDANRRILANISLDTN